MIEGASTTITVNKYERNEVARQACLAHHGSQCSVCNLDFGTVYGPIGDGFIHVHHLVPLSSIGREYEVNPVHDLVPVCRNCHAMLHRKAPPLTIEELREILLASCPQVSFDFY